MSNRNIYLVVVKGFFYTSEPRFFSTRKLAKEFIERHKQLSKHAFTYRIMIEKMRVS